MNGRLCKVCFLLLVVGCFKQEIPRHKVMRVFLPGVTQQEVAEFIYALDSTRSGYQILAKIVVYHSGSLHALTNTATATALRIDRQKGVRRVVGDTFGFPLDEKLEQVFAEAAGLQIEQLVQSPMTAFVKEGKNSWTHLYKHIWIVPQQMTNTVLLLGSGI